VGNTRTFWSSPPWSQTHDLMLDAKQLNLVDSYFILYSANHRKTRSLHHDVRAWALKWSLRFRCQPVDVEDFVKHIKKFLVKVSGGCGGWNSLLIDWENPTWRISMLIVREELLPFFVVNDVRTGQFFSYTENIRYVPDIARWSTLTGLTFCT